MGRRQHQATLGGRVQVIQVQGHRNYDDEAERVRTHPQLLPKPKEAEVVSSTDLKVLSKALALVGNVARRDTS